MDRSFCRCRAPGKGLQLNDFRHVGRVMESLWNDRATDSRVPLHGNVPHDSQDPNEIHASNAAAAVHGQSGHSKRCSEFHNFVANLECGQVPELPFVQVVGLAFRYQQEPGNEDREDWHNPLFHFCRALSGHPKVRGLTAGAAFEIVDSVLSDAGIGWADFDDVDDDSAPMIFILAWDAIKVPPGSSPLRAAVRLAESDPLLGEGDVPGKRPASYLKILNCAVWLAFIAGGTFFLSERSAGELVDVSRMTGHRLLKMAIHDGFLEVVEAHGPNPRNRQATEYMFQTDRLSEGSKSRAETIVKRDRLREACSATISSHSGSAR